MRKNRYVYSGECPKDSHLTLAKQILMDYDNGKVLQLEDFGLNYQDRADEEWVQDVMYSVGIPLDLDDLDME